MKRVKAACMGLLACLAIALAVPAMGDGSPVNINSATVEELEMVSGIGPAKARAIVDHREESGQFASVDDLRSVHGIGGKLLERLRPQVTVVEAAPDTESK